MLSLPNDAIKIAILALLIAGSLYLLPLIFIPAWQGAPFTAHVGDRILIMDFVTWYEAGALALSPDRFHVYDPNVQLEWLNKMIRPDSTNVGFIIAYPPFFFPLMAPMTLVSMKVAYILWNIIWPAVFLLALFGMLKKYAPRFSKLDRWIFLLAVLVSQPSIFSLRLGQTSWWLATCMLFFFDFLLREKNGLAGLVAALSSIKPQYLLFMGLSGLASKRWRLLASVAGAEILFFLLAAIDVGWQSIIAYPSWLAYVETSPTMVSSISPPTMVNLRGALLSFLPPSVTTVIMAVVFFATLAYLFRLWRAPLSPEGKRWAIALTIAAAGTVTPHVHDHDLVFLAIAAALTLPTISIRETAKITEWPLSLWCLLLLYYPFLTWLCYIGRTAISVPLLAFVNIALLSVGILHVERSILRAPLPADAAGN